MAVWVDSDAALCIHPMSDRVTGRDAVAESWRQIFRGDGRMRFKLTNPIYVAEQGVSIHYVYEDISFGDDFAEHSRIIATNVYIKTPQGWRIQAHHGSPGVAAVRRPVSPASPARRVH